MAKTKVPGLNIELKHLPNSDQYQILFNYRVHELELNVTAFSEVFTTKEDAQNALKVVKTVRALEGWGQ